MNTNPSAASLEVTESHEVVEIHRASRISGDYVPVSFEDMFSYYYEFVVKLVGHFGIDRQNSEDVAMTILTKFFEKDVLSDFNPEFTTQYGGVTRKAVFRTFLSGFVRTYVRHYKDRQVIHKRREGFSVDTPMFNYSDTGEAVTWMDYLGPRYYEEHEDLEEADLVRAIRERLALTKPRNAQDQCNMTEFFERVLQQVYETDHVDTAVLAEEFGVSKTSIQNWLKRLRSEVSVVVEER